MKPQDRTRAILHSRLEPSARLLLIAIADHMDGGDSCWVKPETLAGETGLALSSVARWLADLQTAGLLRRWWNGHPCMDHAINWPALATFAPASTGKRGGARPRGPNTDAPNVGPPNIGGGSDYRSDTLRTSEADPPNIGEQPSEHRTRSVPEAIHEATNEATQGEPEGASLTTATDPDATASAPPAEPTSAMEGSYAPTKDPTEEHVNETNDGDRAEGRDFPRVVSGATVGLFGGKWVAALAPEPPPEPKPAPVVVALTPPPPCEPVPDKPKRARKERPPLDENDPLVPLWTALVAFTPAPGAWRLNGERRAMLAERVAEHGPEVVSRVAEWVRTSPHDRARFLRERGDPMTLLRKSKFDAYAAMSAGPVPKVNGANGKPPARRGMLAIEAFMDDDDPGPMIPDRIVIDTTWS